MFKILTFVEFEQLIETAIFDIKNNIADPIAPITIVIPSNIVANYIENKIVDELGFLPYLKFINFHDFLQKITTKILGDNYFFNNPYNPELLFFNLLAISDIEPLSIHLGKNKKLNLLQDITDLIHKYQLFRPELFFKKTHALDEKNNLNLAGIQQNIISQLIEEIKNNPQFRHNNLTYSQIINKAISRLNNAIFKQEETVFIFSLTNLAPLYLIFLENLSEFMDINFYLKIPSYKEISFLEKTTNKNYQHESQINTDNLLLSSFGQNTSNFQKSLIEYTTSYDFENFDSTADASRQNNQQPHSILENIQRDIKFNENPRFKLNQDTDKINNSSQNIKIFKARSIKEEILTIKNQIVDLLNNDISINLSDIVIVHYSKNMEYDLTLQDIFMQKPQIPLSIKLHPQQEIIDFLKFIQILKSDITLENLLSCIQIPSIIKQFELEGCDKLFQMILEEEDFKYTKDELKNNYSIARFFDKLCLNFLQLTSYPEYNEELATPLNKNLSFENYEQIIKIKKVFKFLESSQNKINSLNLAQIINLFIEINTYNFYSLSINNILASLLDKINLTKLENLAMQPKLILNFIEARINNLANKNFNFSLKSINYLPIEQAQSISFNYCFILGLDDKTTAMNNNNLADLTLIKPRIGDINPRNQKLEFFLNLILNTKTYLHLSFCNTNKTEDQSSVLIQQLTSYITIFYKNYLAFLFIEKISENNSTQAEKLNIQVANATSINGLNADLVTLDLDEFNLKKLLMNPIAFYFENKKSVKFYKNKFLESNDLYITSNLDTNKLKNRILNLLDNKKSKEDIYQILLQNNYLKYGKRGDLEFQENFYLVQKMFAEKQNIEQEYAGSKVIINFQDHAKQKEKIMLSEFIKYLFLMKNNQEIKSFFILNAGFKKEFKITQDQAKHCIKTLSQLATKLESDNALNFYLLADLQTTLIKKRNMIDNLIKSNKMFDNINFSFDASFLELEEFKKNYFLIHF